MALHDMLCLLPGPLAYCCTDIHLSGSFYLIFCQTSPNKDCEIMSWAVRRLWLVIGGVVFRPEIPEMVDWVLKSNYLPTYPYWGLSNLFSVKQFYQLLNVRGVRALKKNCDRKFLFVGSRQNTYYRIFIVYDNIKMCLSNAYTFDKVTRKTTAWHTYT